MKRTLIKSPANPEFSLLMVGLEDNLPRRRRLAGDAHPAGLQLCSEPPLPDSPLLRGELILRSVSLLRSVRSPPPSLFPFFRRSPGFSFGSFLSWWSPLNPTRSGGRLRFLSWRTCDSSSCLLARCKPAPKEVRRAADRKQSDDAPRGESCSFTHPPFRFYN